jgi:hypothetical protein
VWRPPPWGPFARRWLELGGLTALSADRAITTMRTWGAAWPPPPAGSEGLATFALGLAEQPRRQRRHLGRQLAERMADLVLDDLLACGVEVVSAERPIVSKLVPVLRTT